MSNDAKLVKVGFQGDEIEAVREGSDVWVALRDPCAALGLDVNGQRQRLKRATWARTCIMHAQVDGQGRDLFMVHLDALPMWLATVEAGRVRPELRPKLVAYQRECARVLRDHFAATPCGAPAFAFPAIAGIVRESPALLGDLRRLVGACARNTAASERQIRGWMVKVSGAASYLRMPLAYGAFVREQLMRVALGEDAPPWRRKALPSRVAQQVFPPPVGPARA